jgi:hypothetical protein
MAVAVFLQRKDKVAYFYDPEIGQFYYGGCWQRWCTPAKDLKLPSLRSRR